MDQETVTNLAEELCVSKDLARVALVRAEGELEKARRILTGMLPRYLFVKVKFSIQQMDGDTGVIFLCVERGAKRFAILRTIVERDPECVQGINVYSAPEVFYRLVQEHVEGARQVSSIHDSNALREEILSRIGPARFQDLFATWDKPKSNYDEVTEFEENEVGESGPRDIGAILNSMFLASLGDIFYKLIRIELDYDFCTIEQYKAVRGKHGTKPTSGQESVAGHTKDEEQFRLYLRGRLAIDPTNGIEVDALEIGDIAYCEIVDRSEVAITAARLIGAYKQGLWRAVRGRIMEVDELENDRTRFRLALARGVFLDTIVFNDLNVRCTDYKVENRTEVSVEEEEPMTSPLPLLIGVVLVAVLVMMFLMMR